jgi:hypothetical protein
MPQERSERGVRYMTLPDRRRNAESIAMSELVKTQPKGQKIDLLKFDSDSFDDGFRYHALPRKYTKRHH